MADFFFGCGGTPANLFGETKAKVMIGMQ